jgi:hypothetical protein
MALKYFPLKETRALRETNGSTSGAENSHGKCGTSYSTREQKSSQTTTVK